MSKIEQFVTFRRKNENNYDLDPKKLSKMDQKMSRIDQFVEKKKQS